MCPHRPNGPAGSGGPEGVDILGIPVSKVDLEGLLELVADAVEKPSPRPFRIAYANAHTCNIAWSNPRFRQALHQVDLVYSDGNGPRVAAWLAGTPVPPHMTGADWIHDLCVLCAQRGYSLYLLGAAEGVACAAAERLVAAHPGLIMRGAHGGYFSAEEWPTIQREIRAQNPDILLLGMASPTQEIWMVEEAGAAGTRVVWATGGMFDFVSGRLRRAPPWMRRLGLEWLGRLIVEPRRLMRRYVLGIPLFLLRAIGSGIARRIHRFFLDP